MPKPMYRDGLFRDYMGEPKRFLSLCNALEKTQVTDNYMVEKRKEVFNMVSFEWSWDDAKKAWLEEGTERGMAHGMENKTNFVVSNMLKKNLPTMKLPNWPAQPLIMYAKSPRKRSRRIVNAYCVLFTNYS